MKKPRNTIINNTKKCSKCGLIKSVTDYYPDKRKRRKPGSVRSTCKKCDITISREYAVKHPQYLHIDYGIVDYFIII